MAERTKSQQEQVDRLIETMEAIITDLPSWGLLLKSLLLVIPRLRSHRGKASGSDINYSNYTPQAKVRAILALPQIGIIDTSRQPLRFYGDENTTWVALIPKE